MRVELPPWFSSVTVNLLSNADSNGQSGKRLHKNTYPLLCLQEGSPPVPDASNAEFRELDVALHLNKSIEAVLQCSFFQKNMTLTFTNEQIAPGILYIGFFNGLGPERTQSKMINRGIASKFKVNLNIEGCVLQTLLGEYCSRTIDRLLCSQSEGYVIQNRLLQSVLRGREDLNNESSHPDTQNEGKGNSQKAMSSETVENVIFCKNSIESSCLKIGESKFYSLELAGSVSLLKIAATDIKFRKTSSVNMTYALQILCYARHSVWPSQNIFDHFSDISRIPLVIDLPKIGEWHFSIHVHRKTSFGEVNQEHLNDTLCITVEWQVHVCPRGTGGPSCSWLQYGLKRVLKSSTSLPFESYYIPVAMEMLSKSANFHVEPLLSNSSLEDKSGVAWTYFFFEVPHGAAGATLHFQVTFHAKVRLRIYVRFGGFPSLDRWDYSVTGMDRSNKSMFLDFSDLNEGRIDFYALYAREGIWSFALRHPVGSSLNSEILMSITAERCPKRCFSHGTCKSAVDASGLTLYSFCSCDVDHGGFDCGIELVTRQGHLWHSVVLVGSNGAAILPAFWALKQKAFAEWILFTSSGISSALYHACDVGTWCVLSFHVLQM